MTLTGHRMFQYVGILLALSLIAGGYWYFAVRAGVKTNTSGSQPQGIGDLSSGLVGYWKFDENTGTSAADSSTNASAGTLTNGPTWTTGQIGSAVNLDGTNDYVTDLGATAADIRGSLSLATWVKFDTLPSSGQKKTLVRNMVSGNHLYEMKLFNNAGTYELQFTAGGGTDQSSAVAVSIATSTWYHMAVTYDTVLDKVSLYFNGALMGQLTETVTGGYSGGTGTLYFGADDGTASFLDGQMDEVRIYDRSLSSDEIVSLYRLTTSTDVDTSLKGYWSFDGGALAGTTAYDWSGAGNTGTLTNGPTVTDGRVGQALQFDGTDDYVDLEVSTPYQFANTTFTVTGWFKSSPGVNGGVFVAQGGSTNYGWWVGLNNNTSGVLAGVLKNTDGGQIGRLSNSTGFNDDKWHQFAFVMTTNTSTYAGNSVVIYADGVLQSSADNSAGSAGYGTSGETAKLGARHDGGEPFFTGGLDEVRIYNRALTAAEIKSFYDRGSPDKSNTGAGQAAGTGNLNSGLTGYWKLDETTGSSAADSSTNGNAGTLTNMENGDWTTGRIGNGLTFDGTNEYVNMGDLTIVDGVTQLTVSAWAKSSSLATERSIITKSSCNGLSDSATFQLGAGVSTGYAEFLVYPSGGTPTNYFDVTATTTMDDGNWHLVTGTYDGSNIRIYMDGVLSATAAAAAGDLSANTRPIQIGACNGSFLWNDMIDEARVYDRALSSDEVAQLYRLTTPTGVDTGLKGYWSMNGTDISGTTAHDRSGAGNNGTLTNSPAVKGGRVGQAFDFFPNGSDTDAYITMGDPSSGSLDFGSGDFAVSLWAKVRGYSNQGSCCNFLMSKYNADSGTAPGYGLYYSSSNVPIFGIHDGTNETAATGTTVLTDGWHHLAGVRTGTTTYLYVDGVLQTTATGSTGSVSNSENFYIGASGTVGQRNVDGLIDEVRVYNRILTAAEVKAQYDAAAPDKTNTSVSTPQGTGRLDSGLVGYWKLDENTGTSAGDASAAGTTGTLTNGPAWVTGRIGSAVDFDGTNDYISLGTPAVLDINGAHSLAAWVKTDVSNTSQTIFVSGTADCCGMEARLRIEYNVGGGTYQFQFTHTDQSSALTSALPTAVQTSTWYHVVGTWDGSGVRRLYVDGALNASDTELTSMTSEYNNVAQIGYNHSVAPEYFNGTIDEVRVYNRELAGEEIANLYRLTAPTGTDTSLKGYWSFNGQDMSSTTAYDRSGAGNNGTLTNGPTVKWGKLGQALQFDGTDDYISYANNIAFDSNDFSIVSWFRLNGDAGGASGEGTIFTQRVDTLGDASPTVNMMIRNDEDVLRAQIRDNAGTIVEATAATPLVPGQWYHGVIVKTATTLTVYLNGGQGGSTSHSLSGDFDTGAVHRFIGKHRYEGGDVGFFNGLIDEVRVYTRALSASEIKALYSSGR